MQQNKLSTGEKRERQKDLFFLKKKISDLLHGAQRQTVASTQYLLK